MSEILLDLGSAIAVLALLGVLYLWRHTHSHSSRIDTIDRRVHVIEDRLADLPDVKEKLDKVSSTVAAIDERTRVMSNSVKSIQDHLIQLEKTR